MKNRSKLVSQKFKYQVLFFSILIVTFSAACSNGSNHALRSEMSGRGQVNLDLSNPYLAPNKFISEEAKSSETLKGFLSLKGAPDSIEFSYPIIGSSTLNLYYKIKNEHYKLEERGNEWIISGPQKIFEREENADLNPPKSLIDPDSNSPALLPLSEKPTEPTLPLNNESSQVEVESKPKVSKQAEFKDTYHEVNYDGQTLTFLAYWYTGSELNSDRIRRINSSLTENLKFGDIVRIPSYILQRDDIPTEKDLQKYLLETRK